MKILRQISFRFQKNGERNFDFPIN